MKFQINDSFFNLTHEPIIFIHYVNRSTEYLDNLFTISLIFFKELCQNQPVSL